MWDEFMLEYDLNAAVERKNKVLEKLSSIESEINTLNILGNTGSKREKRKRLETLMNLENKKRALLESESDLLLSIKYLREDIKRRDSLNQF